MIEGEDAGDPLDTPSEIEGRVDMTPAVLMVDGWVDNAATLAVSETVGATLGSRVVASVGERAADLSFLPY